MMRLKILSVLLLSLIFVGCSAKADKIEKQKVSYVKTTSIETKDFQNKLIIPGKLNPKEQVTVTSKASGTIQSINIEVGKAVKKGQLIAKIDDSMYKIQYDAAKVGVDNANQTLDRMTNFSDETMKSQDIEMAEAAQKSAQTNFENVEKNYLNMKQLYEKGAVAKTDFDSIETQYNLTKQALDTSNEALKQATRGYEYNLKGANIGVEAAKNTYKQAGENLKYTQIFSPISGIVSEKNISVGENINPGAPIFTVVNINEMYVDAGVSEIDISKLKVGQIVKVTVDAYKGEVYEGKISNISPVINENSKTYPIRVTILNKEKKLKAGMFAQLEVILDEHKGTKAVPKEIVLKEGAESFIFVIDKEKAKKKKIQTGYQSNDYIEVISGLTGTEKIVFVGYDALIDGEKVIEKK